MNLPKKIDKSKKKYTKKELIFLTEYASTNNKLNSMKAAGLTHKIKTGEAYCEKQSIERANELLSTQFAKDYITKLHKEIYERNCFTLEKAVNESYENYLMLKEKEKYHEMNISFDTFLKVAGMLKPNGVNVNTQIVASEGGGITINYIKPDENNNNK